MFVKQQLSLSQCRSRGRASCPDCKVTAPVPGQARAWLAGSVGGPGGRQPVTVSFPLSLLPFPSH